jgi:glycine dehydrogenase subunit 2
MTDRHLRNYHAAVWDEPLVMELGHAGRRGFTPGTVERQVLETVGQPSSLVPPSIRRKRAPVLPELSEFEVERHYLHLSQEVLGMMGINLFGTCTMKYNPRVNEMLAARPELAELHPHQDIDTLQGVLQIIHGLDLILRELSGMDQFVFQAGGGADASYTHACVTRAYHDAKSELAQRDQVITSIQAHPCNAATADAAGFHVITLPIEEEGYPSLDALRSVLSERTAALMIGNPDDMGVYNPHIKEWVRLVHEAGGLCFYDHANFNGVMGKIRAREIGFDACMFMLHKTFGAPKGGGGPAVGAYGCSRELIAYLPRPLVLARQDPSSGEAHYELETDAPQSIGKVREFWGNVPQVVKAYCWARSMGAEGINGASDISVLANNYMERRLLAIDGVTKSQPHLTQPRLEMTRYSLAELTEETGVTVEDVEHRMVDFGVDAFWLSHEPWLVPQPFTPEAGETWPKEDIDTWIDVIAQICDEARENPQLVKTAPHNHPIPRLDTTRINDPAHWATTWRAYLRKHSAAAEHGADAEHSMPGQIVGSPSETVSSDA